ncbi:unnamed protein product [[Candida] boidinii]|nr:unnamed protein product [[Candida] boidinii]
MSQLQKTDRPQLNSTKSHGYLPPHGGLEFAQPQYDTHDSNASPYPVDSFANSKPSKYAPASFNIGGSSTSLSGMNINAPTQIAPPQNSSNPISSPQNHLVRSNTTGFSNRVPVLPNNNVGIANSMRNLPHKGPQGVPPSLVQQGTKHANPLADLYAPPPPINGGMTTPRMSPRGSFAEPMATPSPSGSVNSRKSRYAPVTGSPTPAPAVLTSMENSLGIGIFPNDGSQPATTNQQPQPPLAQPPLAQPPLAQPPLAQPQLGHAPHSQSPFAHPPHSQSPFAHPSHSQSPFPHIPSNLHAVQLPSNHQSPSDSPAFGQQQTSPLVVQAPSNVLPPVSQQQSPLPPVAQHASNLPPVQQQSSWPSSLPPAPSFKTPISTF